MTYSVDSIKFQPFSKIKSTLFYRKNTLQMIAQNKKKSFSKFQRNSTIVENDYDLKAWLNILNEKKWLKYDNLLDFILDSKNILNDEQISYIENEICKITRIEYAKFRKEILNFYIKQNIDDSDTIVELGCGWGLNLWTILVNNPQKKLEGYELSENGLNVCKEINNHFNCNVSFGNINLTKNSTFPILKNKSVFTFHVLEQLKYDTSVVIENILKSKPKMVLHFEPVPELYGNTAHEKLVKHFINYMDYQDNLLTTLKIFEKEGRITIVDSKRLHFAANPFFETCLIKWIPT